MKKKRALVIGSGGLCGTYDAGVVFTLCRALGPDYFDAIYGCSSGAYTAAHIPLNQPDSGENVWRNYADGNKLINFFNPLRGRAALDLEYLTNVFQTGETLLYVEHIPRISTQLIFVVTDERTGKPLYVKPTEDTVFLLMRASSAMPILHPPVVFNGAAYVDGALSDPVPFQKAREDGYEDIIVVYNGPRGFPAGDRYDTFSNILAFFLPHQIGDLLKMREDRLQKIDRQLENEKDLKVIRPKIQLPLKSILDTNKARLNACVDMGIADAKEFLKTYQSV